MTFFYDFLIVNKLNFQFDSRETDASTDTDEEEDGGGRIFPFKVRGAPVKRSPGFQVLFFMIEIEMNFCLAWIGLHVAMAVVKSGSSNSMRSSQLGIWSDRHCQFRRIGAGWHCSGWYSFLEVPFSTERYVISEKRAFSDFKSYLKQKKNYNGDTSTT